MINLPKSTEFNKKVPKQKFYENLKVSQTLKRVFIDDVKAIYWKNKIAPSTINIAPGKDVVEIEVFEVHINSSDLDENFFRLIDREIPYHILYILKHEQKQKAIIGYKEKSSGSSAYIVDSYYKTQWMDADDKKLKIEGFNMDAVYENLIRQIAGESLTRSTSEEGLKDSIERSEKIHLLERQIERLKIKLRNEKQLNKQIQINTELKTKKKELEELLNG